MSNPASAAVRMTSTFTLLNAAAYLVNTLHSSSEVFSKISLCIFPVKVCHEIHELRYFYKSISAEITPAYILHRVIFY